MSALALAAFAMVATADLVPFISAAFVGCLCLGFYRDKRPLLLG